MLIVLAPTTYRPSCRLRASALRMCVGEKPRCAKNCASSWADGGGPGQGDHLAGGEEGERGGENGVAGTDAVRHQRQKKSVRTAGAADGMAHPDEIGEHPLQFVHFGTHDVFSVIKNPLDSRIDLRADALLLRLEIYELHGHFIVIRDR
jgi:hypothetical protein